MDNYINISNIATQISDMNAGYAIQSWLRDYHVLEFLMLWESKCNLEFDKSAYDDLVESAKRNKVTITPKMWIENTKAVGLISKAGRNGGTLAHPAIACEFMIWLSPRYRLMIVETFLLTAEGGVV